MSIIIMLLLISVLILVHEAGHFMTAKFFKMKIEKFGFGLPFVPTLYETQWGDTKILVHWLLLGGYVGFPDDEQDCKLDEKSEDRFLNRPIYQRVAVISAGVIANVICAIALVLLTAGLWGHLPSGKYDIFVNKIVAPKTESVWNSGLKDGDKIYEVNGSKIESTYALLSYVKSSKAFDGKVASDNVTDVYVKLKNLQPALLKDEIIPKGVEVQLPTDIPYESPVKIDKMALKGAKNLPNTEVLLTISQKKLRDSIQGKKSFTSDGQYTLNDVAYALSDNYHQLDMKVLRNGKIITLKPLIVNKKGLIGIKLSAKELTIPTKTAGSIVVASTKYLYNNTYMLLYGLYQLCTGKVSWKDLHGIVAITKVGGDVIQNDGIFSGLLLTAIISMDLAIMNFLPIPALDGGHIMFLIIEKLRGKPVKEEVLEKISNAGFLFLILLMFVVIFNDIVGLVTKKF